MRLRDAALGRSRPRKHQVSCTTCHAPFPRLKPFGEEFAARGFRMPDPSQEPTRAERDTGDELLTLFREVLVAVRLEAHGAYREGADAETDFEAPWVGEVLSGGPIGPRISYYVYFIIEKGEVEGLEDACLQFSGLFGSGIDLLAGQFQVSDPLFKRERRDDDPYFLGPDAVEVTTRGGFVELLVLPRGPDGRWALAGLYNRIESDDPAAEIEDVALSLSYLLRRNVRLIAEVGHDLGLEENRASLGIVTAF